VSGQTNITGQWQTVTPLPPTPQGAAYYPVHSHFLPTGKVMIWSGDGGISGDDTTRVWDPATGNVSALAMPGYNTFCVGHDFLADGRLFVVGGHIDNNVGLPNASIYDPFANAWTRLPNMNAGRWYPTATLLGNGDVLVTSGTIDLTVGNDALPQVYQLATNSWRFLTNAQLVLDLYPMMFLAANGQVFMAGPSVNTRYLDTSGAGAWTFVANRTDRQRDYGSAVMYADGKVLTMGGGADPPLNTAEVIDLNQPSPVWRLVGSMRFARRQLNAVMLPDGKVLVTGGTGGPGFNDPGGAVYAAELWDPATEQWTTLASATIPRLYHSTTVLLPDGRVLSMGGNGYPDTEIFSPPYLFKGARPSITSAPTSIGYGQSFFVATPDTGIAKVSMIRVTSVTHAFNIGQRYKQLTFSAASGGVQVTAPPNPNQAPPGYYMLFILNSNGVPSVAKIVELGGAAVRPVPPATPAALSLVYNGKVRDRVGQGNLALGPDGVVDGTLTATLAAAGGRTITRLDLRTSTGGIWETDGANVNWALGMATTLDSPLLNNPSTMAVNAQVADGGSFVVFAADFQNSLFPSGTTLTLTATFADGSGTSATTTVGAAAPPAGGTPALSVVYNGKVRDRVGQDNLALGPDGVLDGTLTATLAATGGRTITRLDLRGSAGGIWETDGATINWALGMAATLDGPLLNNPSTMAVNAQVADGGSFVVFAADFQNSLFLSGTTLTLTATFADGSRASGTATVSGTAPPPAATLTSLAPNSATAGGPGFTLTVNGTNFVSGAVVRWNGGTRTTTFVSGTQLTATIPASDIATQGTPQVTVVNPDGQTSNALTFTINGGAQSPPPVTSFTLTVSRSGPGSVTSSPAGINCGNSCSAAYAQGTVVTLTAVPNRNNARFVEWTGACSGTGACTVTMDAAKSVTARFANR
ncbi:MAG TPA: galactose oxidase-like domain-containing protein, partial [Methylomirabilota bacterium]